MADDTFYEFCGNSSFFNSSLLLDNSWPQFTDCFQKSVLVWGPCGWLWITLPVYVYYLTHLPRGVSLPINLLNTLKSFGCVLLALLAGIDLLNVAGDDEDEGRPVAKVVYVSGAIKLATFMLACGLVQVERRKCVITSGILWIFWLLLTVAGIIPFYSQIIQKVYKTALFRFSLFYVYYALVLLEFILHSFAEKLTQEGYEIIGENPSPEVTASFPNRLTFQWINALVLRAYRKGLLEEDLFDLHPRDKSSLIVPKFQDAWDKEIRKANFINRQRERAQSRRQHYVSYSHSPKPDRHTQEDEATETTSLLLNGATITKGAADAKNKPKQAEASLF